MASTSGRRRSSAGRLLNSLAPKRGPSTAQLIDLTPLEVDLLVSYQLSLPQSQFLGPLAFVEARIVNQADLSARIRDVLVKIAAINPPPSEYDDDTYLPVDTTKITRNFANQLFFCTGLTIRRVVALLFVFEEQCTRWKFLDIEAREIMSLLQDPPAGMEAELRIRLRAVRQRRATLPSQQDMGSSAQDAPPAYS